MKLILKNHEYRYDLENLAKIFTDVVEVVPASEMPLDAIHTLVSIVDPEGSLCGAIYFDGEGRPHQVFESQQSDKDKKNALKRTAYKLLSQATGIESPWGILVGVRPVKIVHEYIDENLSDEAIVEHLSHYYLMRPDKIQLVLNIAHTERAHIFPPDPKEISLYVGIPFCVSRCYYCSFPGFLAGQHKNEIQPYLKALHREIESIAETVKREGFHVASLYIGGGTPTAISPVELSALVDHLKAHFDLSSIKEFTIEAGRPDTLTPDMLKVLQLSGANRLCLNPQTMNDATLKRIGRSHTADEIEALYRILKEDFKVDVNMDLIAGLEGESLSDFAATLDRIIAMKPENVTIHTLSIKRASKLHEDVARYKEALNAEDLVIEMVDLAARNLDEAGYKPYYMYRQKNILANLENVGYAQPNKECLYNMKIIEEKNTLIGMGLGASSKIYAGDNRFERHLNFKGMRDYVERLDEMLEKKKALICHSNCIQDSVK